MSLAVFVYDTFIRVFAVMVRVAAWGRLKARQWRTGRQGWLPKLRKALPPEGAAVWMHCASLGEFEQGRPVLEALKKQYPRDRILLTFFSPSGYEVRKRYAGADHVAYLPLDTAGNAKAFLEAVRPRLVIFVKYEYWYHYLTRLQARGIPVLLVSALFRERQVFFRWYGGLFRRMLECFDCIFVQDETSLQLLTRLGVHQGQLAGDTRFDRVMAQAETALALPLIEAFLEGSRALVAGSTWPADEKWLETCRALFPKWIIAPHEVTEEHIEAMEALWGGESMRYSHLQAGEANHEGKRILIIDNIGLLSALYRYGEVAYIGGGFGQGIHNVLEAAVYGIPVVFGPKYEKFREAVELIRLGAAFPLLDGEDIGQVLERLATDRSAVQTAGAKAAAYVRAQAGATARVMNYIAEKRLLTNS